MAIKTANVTTKMAKSDTSLKFFSDPCLRNILGLSFFFKKNICLVFFEMWWFSGEDVVFIGVKQLKEIGDTVGSDLTHRVPYQLTAAAYQRAEKCPQTATDRNHKTNWKAFQVKTAISSDLIDSKNVEAELNWNQSDFWHVTRGNFSGQILHVENEFVYLHKYCTHFMPIGFFKVVCRNTFPRNSYLIKKYCHYTGGVY